VHEIVGTHVVGSAAGAAGGPTPPARAVQATLAHQTLHTLVVHLTPKAEPQLGGHPGHAIGAEGLLMDLGDQVAELTVGDLPWRRVRLLLPPRINAERDTFIVVQHASTGRSAHRSTMKA
jgi:hypothetical protein